MINLDNLINKINIMPHGKEKAIYICMINSYISFLLDSNQIDKIKANELVNQINEMEVFLKHYVHEEEKAVYCLLDSTEKLNELYKSILTYANNYPLFSVDLPHDNITKLLDYAKDFLFFIDKDALELFNKLIESDLVYESNLEDCGGKCYKLNGNKSAIVIRYNTMPFYKIFTIIHEMGHAYYHYLGKSNPNLIRSNIANESMPRIFEHLFIEYLRNNHLINKNSLDQYERFFLMHELSITNSSYIVNKLLLNDLLDINFHIENIKVNLSFDDYYNLSIIKPKNNDNQEFLAYNYNYYAYAYLLSMVIKERFNKDSLETRKFIKSFPTYARELDAQELIDLFDKTEYVNATNKNTSRVLSKKYYKK